MYSHSGIKNWVVSLVCMIQTRLDSFILSDVCQHIELSRLQKMSNDERVGLIYKITSPSGKSYIGQTVQSFSRRMCQHANKNSRCTALRRAIDKYGWDELTREPIEENIPEDQLNDRERYWIKTCNTITPHGYNLMGGGDCGSHSDISKLRAKESKQKHAIAKNGYRGWCTRVHGLFSPMVKIDGENVYISHGCKTHEEAVEILQRYTADPEGFEMPERMRPRGSGSVHFNKRQGKWHAKGSRDKHIGYFDTEDEAIQVLERYNADPEGFEMPERRRPRGSGCVYFNKRNNKWCADAPRNGKKKTLGCHDTQEEARSALDKYLISNPYQQCSTSSP
jgi:group I intron endonuclease